MTIAQIYPAQLHPAPVRPAVRAQRGSQPTWVMSELAEGVAGRPELWSALAHHDRTARRPVRLVATESYEIWVIGWMPEQGLDLHDHGRSYGLVRVLEGTLLETVLTGEGPRPQLLEAGRRRFLPTSTVHAVKGFGGPATSVHVYSPPLTSMTHYTAEGERIGTEVITPVPAALPAAALAHVLHPAPA